MGDENDHDGRRRGSLVLSTTDGLDLPPLLLSSMALTSPALTTDGEELRERFSMTCDGLSLASEEKDDGSFQKRDDDDDGDDSKDDDSDEEHEETETGDEQGSEEKKEMEGSCCDRQDGSDDEDKMHGVTTASMTDVKHEDKVLEQENETGATTECVLTDRDDGLDDDDMTVECASPRDPMELVDAESEVAALDSDGKPPNLDVDQPSVDRRSDSKPVLVHPLPLVAPTTVVVPPVSVKAYSVKALFPIVYDEAPPTGPRKSTFPNKRPTETSAAIRTPPPVPVAITRQFPSTTTLRVTPRKPSLQTTSGKATDRVVSLQSEVNMLKSQLQSVTKSFSLQVQVADNERKQLAQRNIRLKSQLATLTVDLTRTKADAAKWKTENELFAAKLPRLQAELSEETTQVDEKHAQTIQSQLEITQLRAKAQVFQTRSFNLDTEVEKLHHELRASKKELRGRAIVQQQHEEKMGKLENELHESKTQHAHDLLNAKTKLATTIQRMDHECAKKMTELVKKHEQHCQDIKAVVVKTVRRRKELERENSNLVQQLVALKMRMADKDDENKNLQRQIQEFEADSRQVERMETSLRSQVSSFKAKLQASEAEKNKIMRSAMSGHTLVSGRARPRTRVVPSSPNPDKRRQLWSLDFETTQVREMGKQEPVLCSCCHAIVSSACRLEAIDSAEMGDDDPSEPEEPIEDTTSAFECTRCSTLEQDILKAQEELMQVRHLHTSELKLQAVAYERAIAVLRATPATSFRP